MSILITVVVLACLAAMCVAIGFLPIALLSFAVWRLGPKSLLAITCLSACAEATGLVALGRVQPSINYVEVLIWLFIAGGGFYAAYMVFKATRVSARRLMDMEPSVNMVLETRWSEIDLQGLGFVSFSDLVEVRNQLPGDSDLRRVLDHICARFGEIAFSCGGASVLSPAAAHKYIVNVKRRYRNWL